MLPFFYGGIIPEGGVNNLVSPEVFTIVLDAGHGGMDSGAIGSSPGNREKDINLEVALTVGKLLNDHYRGAVKVLYTRDADYFVKLDERAKIANKAQANIFVSIHTNSAGKKGSTVTGVESYTLAMRGNSTNLEVEKRENSAANFEADGKKYLFTNSKSSEGNIMFDMIQDTEVKEAVTLARFCQQEMVGTGGRNDRGVQQANFAVLRLTYMASVLIELGFISTPEEEAFLMTTEGRLIMSKCIYNAIAKYVQNVTGRLANMEAVSSAEKNKIKASIDAKMKAEEEKKAAEIKKAEEEKAAKEEAARVAAAKKDAATGKVIFKVQIFSSKRQHPAGSDAMKGIAATAVKENDVYKYMCGDTSDYNEIQKTLKKVRDKFPEAFIVAYQGGQKIDIQTAINAWKNQQTKK